MRASNAPILRLTRTATDVTLDALAVSAVCNAFNTLALGLMALMRFESKSVLHTRCLPAASPSPSPSPSPSRSPSQAPAVAPALVRGACCLQSLKVRQLELRDKLQQIVHGFQHQDQHTAADTYWRGWSVTIVQLHAKAQETMEMIPVHPEFVAKAQAEHKFLFKAETQIPFMNLDTMDPGTPRSTNRRNPSPPPSPPADAQAREVPAAL